MPPTRHNQNSKTSLPDYKAPFDFSGVAEPSRMGGEIIIRVVTKCHYFGSDALYNDDLKGLQKKIPRDGRVTDFCRAKRTHWTQW